MPKSLETVWQLEEGSEKKREAEEEEGTSVSEDVESTRMGGGGDARRNL